MSGSHLAYVFERFPTFTQTFCIREVLELERQGLAPVIFSIRDTSGEQLVNYPADLRARVHTLPPQKKLVEEVKELKAAGQLPQSVVLLLRHWGERPDKQRLYEAAYIGHQLRKLGGGKIRVRHAHSHFAGIGARVLWWLRRLHGIGFSFTGHANDLFCKPPEGGTVPALGGLVRDARFVATVSDHSGDWIRERFPRDAGKVHRVFNGLDLGVFPLSPGSAGGGIGSRLIVGVGRLIEKKGFGDLVSACAILRDREIPFACRIIGEGPLEDELRAAIADYRLEGQVKLVGSLPSIEINALLLEEAHVFALPCVVEQDGGMDNLPTVIMEAMAAGVPCVSTRLAGVPEMVVEAGTGLLVEPGDVEGMAMALKTVLVDDGLAARFGKAGRARAEELFDLEKTAAGLAGLLRSHLGLMRHVFRKRPMKVGDKGFDVGRFVGGAEGDA